MALILLLEDQDEFAKPFALLLREHGHEVVVCQDFNGCEAFLQDNHPDIIVVDIFVRAHGRLEPLGGIRLLGHMQKLKLTGNPKGKIPVIAITGSPVRNDTGIDVLQQALAMDAKAVMRKPFAIHTFLAEMDKCLV